MDPSLWRISPHHYELPRHRPCRLINLPSLIGIPPQIMSIAMRVCHQSSCPCCRTHRGYRLDNRSLHKFTLERILLYFHCDLYHPKAIYWGFLCLHELAGRGTVIDGVKFHRQLCRSWLQWIHPHTHHHLRPSPRQEQGLQILFGTFYSLQLSHAVLPKRSSKQGQHNREHQRNTNSHHTAFVQ